VLRTFRTRFAISAATAVAVTLAAAFTLSPRLAVLVALIATALVSWGLSTAFSRRLRHVVHLARRYTSDDLPRWPGNYGDDEIGHVIRAMDDAVLEHKRRLSELERHRARMEAILAEMAEGVLVADRQGRIQLINEAAQRLLPGFVATGDHYIEAVRHPGIVGELTAALRGERPDPVEVSLEQDGHGLLVHATPASDAAGGGAVLVLHDITALRAVDRIRRDFVANVSHELRTPLTAIRGYVEMLDDSTLRPEERREFLSIVMRHTNRMERLVRDLLRLARIEAGQDALEVGRCETGALFRAVATELAVPIQTRTLTIETHIAPEAAAVAGDAAKLHDALRNLVENAVNYSPAGGRIELHAQVSGEAVALSVGDEGPGIPDRDLERVFERFYRVDKSRTQDPGGTGLGLSIARRLVDLHGGRITAANRQPRGALFTIYLPTQPQIQPRRQ
jgi:two-component system, OmpR family, phosphate regulon sensor histidine kinase PhoR